MTARFTTTTAMTGIHRPLPIDPDTVRDHIDHHVAAHLAPDVSSHAPGCRRAWLQIETRSDRPGLGVPGSPPTGSGPGCLRSDGGSIPPRGRRSRSVPLIRRPAAPQAASQCSRAANMDSLTPRTSQRLSGGAGSRQPKSTPQCPAPSAAAASATTGTRPTLCSTFALLFHTLAG